MEAEKSRAGGYKRTRLELEGFELKVQIGCNGRRAEEVAVVLALIGSR